MLTLSYFTVMIARRIFVEGQVQGVFFRESTVNMASELDLAGWVRNRRDGRVEVYAIGPSNQINRLMDFLSVGPPAARVDLVVSEDVLVEELNSFTRRATV